MVTQMGLPAVMGIIKAMKPGEAESALTALRQWLQNQAPQESRQMLSEWGSSGNTWRNPETATPADLNQTQRNLLAYTTNKPAYAAPWREAVAQTIADKRDAIPVYRGMMPPDRDAVKSAADTSWIEPRTGPTSWTTNPSVAKSFGNTILGAKVPPESLVGVVPNFQAEHELIVNMTPELWDQTKVLRNPEQSMKRALSKNLASKGGLNPWGYAPPPSDNGPVPVTHMSDLMPFGGTLAGQDASSAKASAATAQLEKNFGLAPGSVGYASPTNPDAELPAFASSTNAHGKAFYNPSFPHQVVEPQTGNVYGHFSNPTAAKAFKMNLEFKYPVLKNMLDMTTPETLKGENALPASWFGVAQQIPGW